MKIFRGKGMTLIEIMVATFVFTVALGALLGAITGTLSIIETAREQTTAVFDLRNMMERIKATAFSNTVSFFPNNVTDGPVNSYPAMLGGYTLSNEHITISYTNVNSNPLEITAALTWRDRYNRLHTASMSTFKTR
ncbi:MAG: prepilin-type N-terminal cleavage/methylation domain-containing protein [Candidatus Omnitrophica bacterium]|nr:prepilin-type N-terminal cleavage/methylation domain-containing protein [Candidatus Omnitrophota bacterium]